MNFIPASKKPLIDLTAADEELWRDEVDEEIMRLNQIVTALLLRQGGGRCISI